MSGKARRAGRAARLTLGLRRVVARPLVAGLVLAGLVLAGLVGPGPVLGHSLPQSSSPAAGTRLATPPAQVSIDFGERPDPKLSTIKVLDTSGADVTAGSTAPNATNPLQLSVPLKANLPNGVYTVAWRTVSAVDGHLASGSFAFGIGVAPPGPGSGASAGADLGGPLAWGGGHPLAALSRPGGLLGLAVFGALVAHGTPASVRRILPVAWLFAAAGTGLVIVFELADAGVDPGSVFDTSFGPGIVGRVIPLVVAGLAIALVWARPARSRTGLVLVAAGAAGAMLANVALGHTAAGANVGLDVLVQLVHVLAVGLWLGGLLGLVVNLRGTPSEDTARLARRFSRLATAEIVTVAVSGLLRAISEVGTLDALVSTSFGLLVIANALLGLIAVFGAINHFRHVPAAGRTIRGLRRLGSAELLIGATVLLLSASLVNLPPPAETPAGSVAPVNPVSLAGSDFGTSVRVSPDVSPGSAGFNTFTASVTDYDTGAALASATGVSLRFTFPAGPTSEAPGWTCPQRVPVCSVQPARTCRWWAPGRSPPRSSMGRPRSKCPSC